LQITNLIKEMSFDAFLDMLSYIYVVLLEGIKKIVIYNELFSTILTDTQNNNLEFHSDKIPLENEKGLSNKNSQVDDNSNSKESTEIETPTIETHVESGNSKISTASKFTTGIKSIIKRTTFFTTKSQASLPEITPKVSESTSPNSQTNETLDYNSHYATDLSQIILTVTDLAHVWCANLISIRADQSVQLNKKGFYRLFNVTWTFVSECESLCGRACYGLRGTIISQAASVESEQWTQAEVPIDFQQAVNRIVAAAVNGLSDFRCNPLDYKNDNEQTEQTDQNKSDVKLNNNKYIFVEERRFFMVGCSLVLLKIIDDYLGYMANIPPLSTETINKIIEILNVGVKLYFTEIYLRTIHINLLRFIQLFNSRTCQVILGGGARHSAGLKIITAKHLALASQSLGAIITLIPFIRECIRNNLSDKQMIMLTEFDRIKRDYINHQSEVHTKLVSIMDARLLIHLKSFESIMWDESNTKDRPSSYIELLVKEIIKFHNVLNKILPQEILQKIMSDVLKSSSSKLAEEIAKVNIYTPAGKERIIQDVRFYTRKLSALNLHELTNELENVVNNLQVKEKKSDGDENVELTSSST
ncbi:7142_t:CDS:2, partial [Scutellospora calospora]